MPRLTPEEAKEVIKLRDEGATWQALQARFNISVHTLHKLLKGESHSGKVNPQSKEAPNTWPPSRVKAIMQAKGITPLDLATMLGVSERQVRSYVQPENSVRYRRPRGAVAKQLESLAWEVEHKLH